MARAKLTSNNKTVGANLTDSNWNELVNFANNNLDDINSLKSADTTLQENIEAAQAAADEAKAIAEGAVQGKAYDDYQSMIDALEAMSAGDLNIGQVIYIGTSGVPDVWVSANDVSGTAYTYTDDATVQTALQSDDGLSGTWYTLRALDGEKVDLTDYYTKTEVDGKISAIQSTSGSQGTDIETLTQGLADEKTARSDADAALQTSVKNAQSAAESAQSTADAASSAANANANAIDAEVSARKQADADLQQQIDGAAKTGSAVSLSADSSSVLALKPDDITADTSTSGVPYVGGTAGTQATLEACDYALMSKAITLKKGDTLTVRGKVVSVGGVYIYKIVSGTMGESATVELLIKGNTYTATEDMEASIFALPTEGSESTAASLLSAATYVITTPSLKTLLTDERSERIAADDEIRAIAKNITLARSYESLEAMVAAVNAMSADEMSIGTKIYIREGGAYNYWVGVVNSEAVTYEWVSESQFGTDVSGGSIVIGYYELELETSTVDLSDYYTKDTIDGKVTTLQTDINTKQAALQAGIDTNAADIATIEQAVNGDPVITTTTKSAYDTGLLDFIPANASNDSSYLVGMGTSNMCGGISLKEGDVITTVERSDITIYRVYRDSSSQIAENCTIEKLGTGTYTATEDMEVLLYDTQGWGMQTASGSGTFLTYTIQTTTTPNSLNARVAALEAGLTTEAVSDTTEYDDLTAILA